MNVTRREALRLLSVPAGLAALGAASLSEAQEAGIHGANRLKVLVAGGHPDDPESGCGGTNARYVEAGHQVVTLYLTRGEAGIPGRSHEEAARIRTAEVGRACDILGAKPRFGGQVDGDTHVDDGAYAAMRALLEEERPDLILTQWPVDTHPDHRATSLLVYDAWLRTGKKAALYDFEVLTGEQTQVFRPTDYVDIGSVAERKRRACFAHARQLPEEWYPTHERMSRFRGMEHGCEQAEGFVHHDQSPSLPLLA
jgi:LmbE family N-acetylglucosaminyl deacetylase